MYLALAEETAKNLVGIQFHKNGIHYRVIAVDGERVQVEEIGGSIFWWHYTSVVVPDEADEIIKQGN